MGSINTVGLLTIGNVGVGKSFLLDAIAGRAVFRTARRVRAVTAQTTSHTVVVGDKTYTLFDIPGLIEMGNEQKIDSNKRAIDTAFNQSCQQIVLMVMSHLNLRLQQQDLTTFQAVHHAYALHQRSVIFVVNQIRRDDTQEEKVALTAQLRLSLGDACPEDLRVVFIPDIGRNVNFAGPAAQAIRRHLLDAVAASVAHTHTKKHELELRHAETECLRRRLEELERERQRELEERQEQERQEAEVNTAHHACRDRTHCEILTSSSFVCMLLCALVSDGIEPPSGWARSWRRGRDTTALTEPSSACISTTTSISWCTAQTGRSRYGMLFSHGFRRPLPVSKPTKLCMQHDRNLVAYGETTSYMTCQLPKVFHCWASGTDGKGEPGGGVRLDDDGHLRIHDGVGRLLWESK